MVKFYDRIEFSTLNYIEIVTILEASVFYNRLTHKRVFYGYCKLVAQNFSLNAGNWTSVLLLFFFLSFPNRVLYLEINPFPGLREIYSFFENFIFFGVSRRLGNIVKKKKKWNFREKHSVKIFSRKTREYTRKIHSLLSLRIIYRRINRTQGGINRPSLW